MPVHSHLKSFKNGYYLITLKGDTVEHGHKVFSDGQTEKPKKGSKKYAIKIKSGAVLVFPAELKKVKPALEKLATGAKVTLKSVKKDSFAKFSWKGAAADDSGSGPDLDAIRADLDAVEEKINKAIRQQVDFRNQVRDAAKAPPKNLAASRKLLTALERKSGSAASGYAIATKSLRGLKAKILAANDTELTQRARTLRADLKARREKEERRIEMHLGQIRDHIDRLEGGAAADPQIAALAVRFRKARKKLLAEIDTARQALKQMRLLLKDDGVDGALDREDEAYDLRDRVVDRIDVLVERANGLLNKMETAEDEAGELNLSIRELAGLIRKLSDAQESLQEL